MFLPAEAHLRALASHPHQTKKGNGAPSKPEKSSEIPLRQRVLLMDDDPSIRAVASLMLKRAGYELEEATHGNQALRMFESSIQHQRPYAAVVLDLTVLAGLGAKEVLTKLMDMDPKVKTILCSGYCYDPLMENYELFGFTARLIKPFGMEELIKVLRQVIGENVRRSPL